MINMIFSKFKIVYLIFILFMLNYSLIAAVNVISVSSVDDFVFDGQAKLEPVERIQFDNYRVHPTIRSVSIKSILDEQIKREVSNLLRWLRGYCDIKENEIYYFHEDTASRFYWFNRGYRANEAKRLRAFFYPSEPGFYNGHKIGKGISPYDPPSFPHVVFADFSKAIMKSHDYSFFRIFPLLETLILPEHQLNISKLVDSLPEKISSITISNQVFTIDDLNSLNSLNSLREIRFINCIMVDTIPHKINLLFSEDYLKRVLSINSSFKEFFKLCDRLENIVVKSYDPDFQDLLKYPNFSNLKSLTIIGPDRDNPFLPFLNSSEAKTYNIDHASKRFPLLQEINIGHLWSDLKLDYFKETIQDYFYQYPILKKNIFIEYENELLEP